MLMMVLPKLPKVCWLKFCWKLEISFFPKGSNRFFPKIPIYAHRHAHVTCAGTSELALFQCVCLIMSQLIKWHIQVAKGGSDDILRPTLDDKLNTLHETIASLASESKSEASEEEHVLENFHSSRTIRKLVMDCPKFASTLWKNALKGKSELWAQGHRWG